MGRPRKPTALKVVTGNPGRRALNRREPQPQRVLSDPPEWLSEDAERFYRTTGEVLLRLGVVTEIDHGALAVLSQCWANIREARRLLAKYGDTTTKPSGTLTVSPYKRMEREAYADFIRYGAEFGITPASRARVATVNLEELDDPFSDL
jgi:P27 family predicted phage terminase small subunit